MAQGSEKDGIGLDKSLRRAIWYTTSNTARGGEKYED
jgi:hypothetical protein